MKNKMVKTQGMWALWELGVEPQEAVAEGAAWVSWLSPSANLKN